MEWLNYHHLMYFWTVAREGTLVAAGKVLRLSHPTLSAQIHALEDSLGEKLFVRTGRRLVLTEMGHVVYRFAEEIFSLGREMVDTVHGRASGQPLRVDVGIADAVPKLIVHRLLQPALGLPTPIRLVCHEDSYERLLANLSLHTLDIVISDAPVPPGSSVRAFNHLLGETGVSFFATKALARSFRRGFPTSLDGAPLLLPLETLTLRRSLNQWLDRHDIKPRVLAEFEDSALLKVFGADGVGIFPAPTVMEADVCRQYGVQVLGRVPEVRERFYAISIERKLKNPAIVAISEAAQHEVFGDAKGAAPRGRRDAVPRRT
jgi:LysR family transcriptional activator of nhaA